MLLAPWIVVLAMLGSCASAARIITYSMLGARRVRPACALRRQACRACSSEAVHDMLELPPRRPVVVGLRSDPAPLVSPRQPSSDPWDEYAVEGVTVVRDEQSARRALDVLNGLSKDVFHAIDTETTGLDIKKMGPVGNGQVLCASIYAGPDVDFGNGPLLWIDNWSRPDPEGRSHPTGLLRAFVDYFANKDIKKVFHNFSFDRHVLNNEGIVVRGFAADTMHMARLWDTSLGRGPAALVAKKTPGRTAAGAAGDDAVDVDQDEEAAASGYSLAALTSLLLPREAKRSMTELFGYPRTKRDGTKGKVIVVPEPLELQTVDQWRKEFITYSAKDAKVTWDLREELETRLRGMPWGVDRVTKKKRSMQDFYASYMAPFGVLLTDMEAKGFKVDLERLPRVEKEAEAERAQAEAVFRAWAATQSPHARFMNINSGTQLGQLLFAPPVAGSETTVLWPPGAHPSLLPATVVKAMAKCAPAAASLLGGGAAPGAPGTQETPAGQGEAGRGAKKAPATLPACRAFKVSITEGLREAMHGELQTLRDELADREPDKSAAVHKEYERQLKALDRRKQVDIHLTGIGLESQQRTASGMPSTKASTLKDLAETLPDDSAARQALGALTQVSALDKMLSSFIRPLQELAKDGRIHSSLNINTETGRLSSQRPNLQNQPALDKVRETAGAAGVWGEALTNAVCFSPACLSLTPPPPLPAPAGDPRIHSASGTCSRATPGTPSSWRTTGS